MVSVTITAYCAVCQKLVILVSVTNGSLCCLSQTGHFGVCHKLIILVSVTTGHCDLSVTNLLLRYQSHMRDWEFLVMFYSFVLLLSVVVHACMYVQERLFLTRMKHVSRCNDER